MLGQVRDFVDSISDGDNLAAETHFNNALASKVGDALETKRKEVANTFVKSSVTQDEGDGEEV